MPKRKLNIFCDGACHVKTGRGGYGAVIIDYNTGERKELYGGYTKTTNNRMEIMSVIKALESLDQEGCDILIASDSQYVLGGISSWLPTWQKRNWRGVKNPDLWQKLIPLLARHSISTVWIKGHSGEYPEHTRADELAVAGSNLTNLPEDFR